MRVLSHFRGCFLVVLVCQARRLGASALVDAAAQSLATLLLLCAAACSKETTQRSSQAPPTPLVVLAAASLADVFAELVHSYERSHPNTDLQLSFAGSQVLRLQIESGVQADLFVSANQEHMAALERQGLVKNSRRFAGNELALVVPLSNPAGLQHLRDLPRSQRLVLGTEQAPIGVYSRRLLAAATPSLGERFADKVMSRVASEESNTRLVRAKVELAEADAALVYKTDALSSKKLRLIPIPETLNVDADYLIGSLTKTRQSAAAASFVSFLLSTKGRDILMDHGYKRAARP